MARVGRPKLEDSRDHQVSVRFSDKQLARLEAYCNRFNLKKSEALMKGFEELERQAKMGKK